MNIDPPSHIGRILVMDLESAPDPQAAAYLPARERGKMNTAAVHRIVALSSLEAEEREDGSWSVARVRSLALAEAGVEEFALLETIDTLLKPIAESGGLLITFNGDRHDLMLIRRRAANHLLFGTSGIGRLSSISHRDLMTDSIAGGGPWFKLRDVAAGLGIPIAHELPSRGLGLPSRPARKGEVDVVVTFLLFLFDLADRRGSATPVHRGWKAVGDYLRRAGPHGEHLAQFRRHPLGAGDED